MSDATPDPDAEKLLAQARQAAAKNEWEQAIAVLEPAPDLARVLDKRAFYLSRAKRYDEACAVLTVLRQREPGNFLWRYMTGYQYYVQERYDEAVPWFVEAYKLNRSHVRNLYRLAQCRRHQGELVRAQRAAIEVRRLWQELPDDGREREEATFAKASYLLGKLQADRDPRGAIEPLKQAAEHDPRDHDKHYLLGKTHRRLGEREAAIDALRRARRLKPNRAYIELEYAAALAEEGDRGEAIRCLSRVRVVRGWQAWKAARVALAVQSLDDAERWLAIAAKDHDVTSSPKYEELKAAVDTAVAERPEPESSPARRIEPSDGGRHQGKVHHIRGGRGFGFLVDDSDGARCYFKLTGGRRLSANDAVEFVRADTERGPAAREVRLLVTA
jgi:tetratricopeptide (TPR) repeat protein/cold shock CspA family protein